MVNFLSKALIPNNYPVSMKKKKMDVSSLYTITEFQELTATKKIVQMLRKPNLY